MSEPLAGRQILLGVTGGIAAYKSVEVVRRLRAAGADVRVMMTAAAQHFVTTTTFAAVSGHTVRDDLWDEAAEAAMGHIELARWADLVLIAPASADSIARLSAGMADDLLSTVCLATTAPVLVAPAMNRQMWAHPATAANCRTLSERGVALIGPGVGDQACGETGPGRVLEPEELVAEVIVRLTGGGSLAGRRVMITAGPTREHIDPVRFVSNRSSGKMGYAVAAAAAAAGAEVLLISGPVSLPVPAGVRCVDVESAAQMHAAVMERIAGTDIFIATAAVADYTPAEAVTQKIKKRGAGGLTLEMEQTTDILQQVAALPDAPFTVGFAAETDDLERHARAKLAAKHLDMIAANRVGDDIGFDRDDNELTVFWEGGSRHLPRAAKSALARDLIAVIAERFTAGGRPGA